MNNEIKKASYIDILNSLPENLQIEFKHIVEDYKFSSEVRHGKQFVSYAILGDLIKAGWRRSAQAMD